MRYEESAVLELKEQVNADFKKEIIALPIRTAARYLSALRGTAASRA